MDMDRLAMIGAGALGLLAALLVFCLSGNRDDDGTLEETVPHNAQAASRDTRPRSPGQSVPSKQRSVARQRQRTPYRASLPNRTRPGIASSASDGPSLTTRPGPEEDGAPLRTWPQPEAHAPANAVDHRVRPKQALPAEEGPREFEVPELRLPATGTVRSSLDDDPIAPFKVSASRDANYLVKLAAGEDQYLTLFVPRGQTCQIEVPLGTYELRFASGDRWYGYEHLFGPETACQKGDTPMEFSKEPTHDGHRVSGCSITLYRVPGGNMRTRSMDVDDF